MSAGRLSPGVDVRGRGSYVLLPPSTVNGRPYRWLNDLEAAPLPAEIERQAQRKELPRLTAAEGVELDSEWMLDLARDELHRLVAAGDVAREGEGGDDRTYRLFTRLYELGISEAGAVDLVAEEWNPHCDPPWSDDELEAKAEHAWRYKQNEAGSRALPDPTVWKVEQYAPPPGPPAELDPSEWPCFETVEEIAARPEQPVKWLWQGRMMDRKPVYITGRDGSGKTTIAENMAVAFAAGMPLWGRDTLQQRVYILVGEDDADYVSRNLKKIRAEMEAPESCLANIFVLSAEDMDGGGLLATIDDEGNVSDTPFMRHIAGLLRPPCVFIIDPLETFVRFNRYKNASARALCATWLNSLCRVGVTPIVNDHPSKASEGSGDYYGGVPQLRAPFGVHAVVLAGEWKGELSPRQQVTFSFQKLRRARKHDIKLVRRENSPVYTLWGGASPDDHTIAVYLHIRDRLDEGLAVSRTANGEHGPDQIARALLVDIDTVQEAIKELMARDWLRKAEKGEGGGYAVGHKAPSTDSLRF